MPKYFMEYVDAAGETIGAAILDSKDVAPQLSARFEIRETGGRSNRARFTREAARRIATERRAMGKKISVIEHGKAVRN